MKSWDLNSREVFLQGSRLVVSAVKLVQLGKCTLGPDAEATDVSSGGELKEVQTVNTDEFDTRNVSESANDTLVFIVDDEGTTTLTVSASTHLSFTGTGLARVRDLDNIRVGLEGLQDRDGLLGLGDGFDLIGYDERNLGDLLDPVTTGKD
jgi:hypothetical protein